MGQQLLEEQREDHTDFNIYKNMDFFLDQQKTNEQMYIVYHRNYYLFSTELYAIVLHRKVYRNLNTMYYNNTHYEIT